MRPPAYPLDDRRESVHGSVLKRLRWLSVLMDTAIRLPGGYRIGLDGIIGLIPGLGDALGTLVSAYIIAEAARLGAPTTTLIRMIGNVALEAVVGLVPILGDLFDIAWKANVRNLALLNAQLGRSPVRRPSNRRLLALLLGVLAVLVLGVFALGYLIFKLIAAMA